MIYRAILAFLLMTGATRAAAPWWQALGPVEKGEYGGGHMDDDDALTPGQKTVLAATRFDKWVDYEDEWVELRYPKHPDVSFRVSKGGDGLKVEGGVVTTVDNSFQQAYILEVGKATYGVFLLLEDEDGSLVEKVFGELGRIEIGDPAAVGKLVEKLPEGERGSDWHEQRTDAFKALSPRTENPGD